MSSDDDFDVDLDEEVEAEEAEASLISTTDDFMEQMESSFNEDILERQGVTQTRGNFFFTGLDGEQHKITFKEKAFSEAYLSFKGNAIDAVISAGYEVRRKNVKGERIDGVYNRKLASVIASELLKKPNVTLYMQTLYEKYGFTDEAVEREHLFLINQNADLRTKKSAIDMFYNLKGRYPAKKMDLTSMGEKVVGINYVNPTGETDND